MLASEDTLDPLFADENDRNEFRHRHYINKVRKIDIKGVCRGNVYLGLDVGSTTTKAVLIDDNDSFIILFL